jgi:peptidoglycan/LPS O-acetylase OafA/YrhL
MVVLFHAGLTGTRGGYVGVDVFFVISGFLITQLLLDRGDAPLRLSLGQFYVRRARRILPALIVTCCVVALAATLVLLPWDLRRFGKFLASTPVFATNLAAWIDGDDYFAQGYLRVPLTHLWSIAIEEQFYLLYPLVLLALASWAPRWRTPALVLACTMSLALCVWASFARPGANFYLPVSRAWELLLGALMTLAAPRWTSSRRLNEWLAGAALAALALAVAYPQPELNYPLLYAIAPCTASALLLVTAAHGQTAVAQLLSRGPLVFTGKASYSIYLWHLPIFALYKYYNLGVASTLETWTMIGATYAVAVVSWKWVEQPIRTRAWLRSDRTFVWSAIAANAFVLGLGIFLWTSHGLPSRFTPDIVLPFDSRFEAGVEIAPCVMRPLRKVAAGDLCRFGDPDPRAPRVLVWGDSHSMALVPAYRKLAKAHGVQLYLAALPSCRPLMAPSGGPSSHCLEFNAAVLTAVRRLNPQLIILNAYWMLPGKPLEPGVASFRQGLENTLADVAPDARSVCVVLDVPTYDFVVPYAVAISRMRGLSQDFLRVSRARALDETRSVEADIRAAQAEWGLTVVDPKDVLCRTDECTYEQNGQILYADHNHLAPAGAEYVASTLEPCFARFGNQGRDARKSLR